MLTIKGFIIVFLTTLAFVEIFNQPQGDLEPDPYCLGCICEAASKCNRTVGCKNGICGLFRFGHDYWLDAHKPVVAGDDPDSEEAWVNCAKNVYCSARTVMNYMERYRKDCNEDGEVNCEDFAWIHHLGGGGCGSVNNVNALYKLQFTECINSPS